MLKRKIIVWMSMAIFGCLNAVAQTDWQKNLNEKMPLMEHRNWIGYGLGLGEKPKRRPCMRRAADWISFCRSLCLHRSNLEATLRVGSERSC